MSVTGTEKNPIHNLRPDHIIGLRNTTVYYHELSDSLNMFWAQRYAFENNITFKKVKKANTN